MAMKFSLSRFGPWRRGYPKHRDYRTAIIPYPSDMSPEQISGKPVNSLRIH